MHSVLKYEKIIDELGGIVNKCSFLFKWLRNISRNVNFVIRILQMVEKFFIKQNMKKFTIHFSSPFYCYMWAVIRSKRYKISQPSPTPFLNSTINLKSNF